MSLLIRWLIFGVPLVLVACNPASLRPIEATRFAEIAPLETPQAQQDRLPEKITSEAVDSSRTRLLGAHANHTHWVAIGQNPGQICAISMIETEDVWMSGTGCGSVVEFRWRGVSVAISGLGQYGYTVVIPDGYAADARRKLTEAVVMPNLIAFESEESLAATVAEHGEKVLIAHRSRETEDELELYLDMH